MPDHKKPKMSLFSEVATATGGNKTEMAKRLGCDRRTVNRWIEEDAEFASIIEEVNEGLVDLAETQARRLIAGVPLLDNGKFIGWQVEPSVSMNIFILKTKGKDRGYVERHEHTGKNGKDLVPSTPFQVVDPVNPDQIVDLDIGADIPV